MIKVKLYGQPTSTYEYAKMKLLEATSVAGIDIELIEINDVNDFISEGIKSVPSFKVNGGLEMNYDKNRNIDDFVHETIQYILKQEDFGELGKIIVPTDFSVSSENALKYAYQLAHYQNKVLKLVHAYHPVSVDIDGTSVIDPHLESIKRKQLKKLCLRKQDILDLEISAPLMDEEFRIGFATEEIVDLSKDEHTDTIIMGSTGKGSTLKKWFGSVSLEVLKKAKSPVLIIPPDANFTTYKNVIYASDNPILDTMTLEMLSEYLTPFKFTLHIVHVTANSSASQADDIKTMVKSFYAENNVKYQDIAGDDISESIENYANEHDIDLIVMTRKKRTLLDAFINPSVTKKMAIHTHIPLLVYHEDGKICNCGGSCKKVKSNNQDC